MSSPIFLVAPQRSGTTVFQNTIAEGDVCAAFGEVFHENKETYRLNFFNFLNADKDAAKLYQYKTSANSDILFSRYINFLSSATEKKFHFVDVKENSVHHFDCIWRDVFSCPEFLTLVMRYNFPIVRIKRRNLFLQVLSQDVSSNAKQWHFRHDEIIPKIAFDINCSEYFGRIERFEREGKFIDNCLENYSRKIELYYEDLFEHGRISEQNIARLESSLGENIDASNPLVFKKTVANPSAYVKNINEVRAYFDETVYADMVEEGFSI